MLFELRAGIVFDLSSDRGRGRQGEEQSQQSVLESLCASNQRACGPASHCESDRIVCVAWGEARGEGLRGVPRSAGPKSLESISQRVQLPLTLCLNIAGIRVAYIQHSIASVQPSRVTTGVSSGAAAAADSGSEGGEAEEEVSRVDSIAERERERRVLHKPSESKRRKDTEGQRRGNESTGSRESAAALRRHETHSRRLATAVQR